MICFGGNCLPAGQGPTGPTHAAPGPTQCWLAVTVTPMSTLTLHGLLVRTVISKRSFTKVVAY